MSKLQQNAPLPEVLAPAGDRERLEMALAFGADAVYLGGENHSMRAAASGFSPNELKAAAALCHEQGARCYFTCNTLPRCDECGEVADLLKGAKEAGVDAVIAADLGVMALAKQIMPDTPLHISTQAGVVNHLTANALYEMGARRVVLARECSLAEIQAIRQNTPPDLEIEVFVHGAICLSFSGRCLLSDYLIGRDANRGACAQPCRWKWHLMEEKRPNEFYPVHEEENASYILNAKDLCLIEHLHLLYEAGVCSFKIEGRAKSALYTAIATGAYRAAVDSLAGANSAWQPPDWAVRELSTISHREYGTGFLFGPPHNAQSFADGGYIRDWEMIAVVTGYRDGFVIASQRGKFSLGDVLEALEPRALPVEITVHELYDGTGAPISSAPHPKMQVRLPYPRPLAAGSILRKQRS